jgi:hypothetical protein
MRMLRTHRLLASPRFALGLSLAFVLWPGTASRAEKHRKPTTPLSAQDYPMHDAHGQERVTIAAEPGDIKETRPNTRLNYFDHDMLPIRIIVTNDSDFPLTLDDARIHLIAGDNTVVPAATDDDLQRRMFTFKSATGSKVPLPLPLPPLTIHHNTDKKIVDDENDFGFQTTTVKPHTTVAGYLFYDMQGLDKPVLEHATLELRKVRFAVSNRPLDSFEIPLHPTTPDGSHPKEEHDTQ